MKPRDAVGGSTRGQRDAATIAQPDVRHAQLLLRALGAEAGATFQTFPEAEGATCRPWIVHGSLGEHAGALLRANRDGAGVFFMVNEGDGAGRAARNVVRVRAVFVDLDGAPFPQRLPLTPHVVTETSPGRFHIFWRVADVPLDRFGTVQVALAESLGGDSVVKDLPRVMRLPGFLHRKREPFLSVVRQVADHRAYELEQVARAFPRVRRALQKPPRKHLPTRPAQAADYGRWGRYARAALESEVSAVAQAPEGARNVRLNQAAFALGGFVAVDLLDPAEVRAALLVAAGECGLPHDEAAKTIASGITAGMRAPRELPDEGSDGRE